MSETTQIVMASRPEGAVKPENFRLESAPMPALPTGGILVRSLYLSLDPYMRGRMSAAKSYAKSLEIGDVITGESVTEVIASDNPAYHEGDIVLAPTGWRTHAAFAKPALRKLDPAAAPITTGLGVLGMPGFTAYGGLKVIGQPKPGETLAVAAASGPVGSLVGQLGKMWGCTVVGIAGGADKCAYVTGELGFESCLDHRAPDFPTQLAAACPKGIDIYFENVGGAVWQAVLPLLNQFARVPVCGIIATYNGTDATAAPLEPTWTAILRRSMTVRGFINYDFAKDHFADFLTDVGQGLRDGKIRYREDITEGLENAPATFMGLLTGKNFGKALIKLA